MATPGSSRPSSIGAIGSRAAADAADRASSPGSHGVRSPRFKPRAGSQSARGGPPHAGANQAWLEARAVSPRTPRQGGPPHFAAGPGAGPAADLRFAAALAELQKQGEVERRSLQRQIDQLERRQEHLAVAPQGRERWAELQGSVHGLLEEVSSMRGRVESFDEKLRLKVTGFEEAMRQRTRELEQQLHAQQQKLLMDLSTSEETSKRHLARFKKLGQSAEDHARRISLLEEHSLASSGLDASRFEARLCRLESRHAGLEEELHGLAAAGLCAGSCAAASGAILNPHDEDEHAGAEAGGGAQAECEAMLQVLEAELSAVQQRCTAQLDEHSAALANLRVRTDAQEQRLVAASERLESVVVPPLEALRGEVSQLREHDRQELEVRLEHLARQARAAEDAAEELAAELRERLQGLAAELRQEGRGEDMLTVRKLAATLASQEQELWERVEMVEQRLCSLQELSGAGPDELREKADRAELLRLDAALEELSEPLRRLSQRTTSNEARASALERHVDQLLQQAPIVGAQDSGVTELAAIQHRQQDGGAAGRAELRQLRSDLEAQEVVKASMQKQLQQLQQGHEEVVRTLSNQASISEALARLDALEKVTDEFQAQVQKVASQPRREDAVGDLEPLKQQVQRQQRELEKLAQEARGSEAQAKEKLAALGRQVDEVARSHEAAVEQLRSDHEAREAQLGERMREQDEALQAKAQAGASEAEGLAIVLERLERDEESHAALQRQLEQVSKSHEVKLEQVQGEHKALELRVEQLRSDHEELLHEKSPDEGQLQSAEDVLERLKRSEDGIAALKGQLEQGLEASELRFDRLQSDHEAMLLQQQGGRQREQPQEAPEEADPRLEQRLAAGEERAALLQARLERVEGQWQDTCLSLDKRLEVEVEAQSSQLKQHAEKVEEAVSAHQKQLEQLESGLADLALKAKGPSSGQAEQVGEVLLRLAGSEESFKDLQTQMEQTLKSIQAQITQVMLDDSRHDHSDSLREELRSQRALVDGLSSELRGAMAKLDGSLQKPQAGSGAAASVRQELPGADTAAAARRRPSTGSAGGDAAPAGNASLEVSISELQHRVAEELAALALHQEELRRAAPSIGAGAGGSAGGGAGGSPGGDGAAVEREQQRLARQLDFFQQELRELREQPQGGEALAGGAAGALAKQLEERVAALAEQVLAELQALQSHQGELAKTQVSVAELRKEVDLNGGIAKSCKAATEEVARQLQALQERGASGKTAATLEAMPERPAQLDGGPAAERPGPGLGPGLGGLSSVSTAEEPRPQRGAALGSPPGEKAAGGGPREKGDASDSYADESFDESIPESNGGSDSGNP